MKKSNLKLELYKLDELPDSWPLNDEGSDIEEELEKLRVSDKEILEKYKPSDMAARIALKLEEEEKKADNVVPFTRKLTTRVLIPAAAALLVLAFLLPFTMRSFNGSGLEMTRVKGADEPRLHVYRKTGRESELLNPGSNADQKDLLQLTYQVNGPSFGLILSVDGRGVVTKHYPESEGMSPRLTAGGEQFLPFSYELDDAPGFETFYLITADKPFSTEAVMDITAAAAATRQSVLDIPGLIKKNSTKLTGKFKQFAVPIRKEKSHE